MKKLKLVIFSILLCNVIFLSSCSNTSQNNVVVNNNEETITSVDETTVMDKEQVETKEIEKPVETQETQEATEQVKNVENETTANENIVNNEENNMSNNNILVAYFSATGTTKRVAEKIAELTGADIYEIVPKNPYSEADLNWNDSNSRSTKEMDDLNARPEIGSDDIDLSSYNTIYLGYPIWWGDAPRIMATFVEKYNFDGKKVIPFCTSGGSGIGRSGSNLATLAGSGNFVNGERLNSSADTNNIQNFINNNNK